MHTFTDRLLSFVKTQEGFSATPYTAPEGKGTIGYGHLNIPLSKVDTYLADALLREDLHQAELRAQRYVDRMYGEHTYEALDQVYKDALIELVFNVGTLYKFPKFTRALVRGKKDKAIAESTRYYRDPDGHLHPLERRNAAFITTFLT